MTPIDDLKRGDWVAIVGCKAPQQDDPWDNRPTAFDGVPFQIMAISLPFMAVKNVHGKSGSIDIRVLEFKKVTRQYVEAAAGVEPRRKKRRKRPEAEGQADPKRCVRCGNMMVQRMFMKPDRKHVWKYWCDQCAAEGGVVKE